MANKDTEREAAVNAFHERKAANSQKERVDNGSLWAGSPMYYYCRHCGEEDKKPEIFNLRTNPIKNPCDPCRELIEKGWMPAE